MVRKPVQILGAGGHARVVIATLEESGHEVVGVYDDDPARHGNLLDGAVIRGFIADAPLEIPTIIAIGSNRHRAAIADRVKLQWAVAVHPTAYVHRSVSIGVGTVVFAHCAVQPGAVLGAHVIVNTAASVDHDCHIGSFAHLGPGTRLCGAVCVGEGALLGVATAARPQATVGAWSTVGAGAVVIEDIPPNTVAFGAPARVHERSS